MTLTTQVHVFNKPVATGQGDVDLLGMLAFQIMTNHRISLAGLHVHKLTKDHATAKSEARSLVLGYLAGRSNYNDGKTDRRHRVERL
jgi:hypothetical protein